MSLIIITGGSSGLGLALLLALEKDHKVTDWSFQSGVDVTDGHSIEMATRNISGQVDVLINCAGVNEINYLPQTTSDEWDKVMDTNAKAIFRVSQSLLSRLHGGTILNIVSNASHVPMTASIAYNASKGAAAIMTRQMARELGKTHAITVFGISPNKLAGTGMSRYIDRRVQIVRRWTADQAREYQLAALPAGEETDPATLAEFVAFLLREKRRHKYLAGCILEYGA